MSREIELNPPETYYAEECKLYLAFSDDLHRECTNCRNCNDEGICIHPDALFYKEKVEE